MSNASQPNSGDGRIAIECPTCKSRGSVPLAMASKSVRCKKCNATFLVASHIPPPLPVPSEPDCGTQDPMRMGSSVGSYSNQQLIEKLDRLADEVYNRGDRSRYPHPTEYPQYKEIRAIGEYLNSKGRIALMKQVYSDVPGFRDKKRCMAELWWDGIGSWSAGVLLESYSTQQLIDKLDRLAYESEIWGHDHSYPKREAYPQYKEIRAIGEYLNSKDGFTLMKKIYNDMYRILGESWWSGIGRWQG